MSSVVLFFKYESNECCEKYKILKSEKKINKNMYILFKDILIICFCFFCLISVFCLIFINDFCVDML